LALAEGSIRLEWN